MKKSNDETFNATIGNTVLCDGFLVPMTDFVLEQLNEQNSRTKPMREVFNSLEKYATFLRQPLKLEMFVPCDEKGNVLEEPQMRPVKISFDEEDMDYDAQELYDYRKAKEKVLFENLSYKFGFVGLTDSKGNFSSLFNLDFKPNEIIEDLLKEKYKFSFTAFALERIFGKSGA